MGGSLSPVNPTGWGAWGVSLLPDNQQPNHDGRPDASQEPEGKRTADNARQMLTDSCRRAERVRACNCTPESKNPEYVKI